MDITSLFAEKLFDGTTVFVTGGGSGINLGIAKSYAALGADLSICGRTPEKLDAARQELEALGAQVVTSVVDVRSHEALARALAKTEETLGPVHTVVCGAAGNFPCPAENLSANGFKSVVDIDLLGSFNTARAAFDQLKGTRGNLIFISAGQAMVPYPLQAHVGAAKAGVDNLMRNLALEWGQYGIRSNSIAPGPIAGTEGVKRLVPSGGKVRAQLEAAVPLGRFGEVEDIGAAAAYLASPLAAYVTGTILVVDGGQNLPGSGLFTTVMMQAMTGK